MIRAAPRLRLRRVLPALAVMAACLLLYAAPGALPWLDWLEGQSLSARFRLRGPVAPGPDVVMVVIDNESIAARGAWPPARGDLARLVDLLAADGARVIAFDLLLGARPRDVPRGLAAVLREARTALAETEPALAA
ncbi:MAG: CHASE2 domain-containing protein, partial [Alphaproteobacteria bacterium]|nr:CHASE2 domain-containing protein [Alphaproteobacteria bacterium]